MDDPEPTTWQKLPEAAREIALGVVLYGAGAGVSYLFMVGRFGVAVTAVGMFTGLGVFYLVQGGMRAVIGRPPAECPTWVKLIGMALLCVVMAPYFYMLWVLK